MLCQHCQQYETVGIAKCQINGRIGYYNLCIHCIQPIYRFVAQFATKVEYEEVKA